ncbi:MAG: hypothetical protein Terrestrivirus5_7 [Terrestrivirus sp.]|uniref:Uncharacterized protein n=1 Tax=Terrestrivirus sp. TaxID=2487775 RepID=A0A3G4ZMV0_9VIRU|nr:MAG: hypothetical protein Terrestrivirus5_7 [Terrestrivirus sp.]
MEIVIKKNNLWNNLETLQKYTRIVCKPYSIQCKEIEKIKLMLENKELSHTDAKNFLVHYDNVIRFIMMSESKLDKDSVRKLLIKYEVLSDMIHKYIHK